MYIAAVRLADEFGCDAIGIQYQQGLKDLRPPAIWSKACSITWTGRRSIAREPARVYPEGEAMPHFNEVDECAGLDGLVTNRLWRELGFAPENTLHDLALGPALTRRRPERLCLGVP